MLCRAVAEEWEHTLRGAATPTPRRQHEHPLGRSAAASAVVGGAHSPFSVAAATAPEREGLIRAVRRSLRSTQHEWQRQQRGQRRTQARWKGEGDAHPRAPSQFDDGEDRSGTGSGSDNSGGWVSSQCSAERRPRLSGRGAEEDRSRPSLPAATHAAATGGEAATAVAGKDGRGEEECDGNFLVCERHKHHRGSPPLSPRVGRALAFIFRRFVEEAAALEASSPSPSSSSFSLSSQQQQQPRRRRLTVSHLPALLAECGLERVAHSSDAVDQLWLDLVSATLKSRRGTDNSSSSRRGKEEEGGHGYCYDDDDDEEEEAHYEEAALRLPVDFAPSEAAFVRVMAAWGAAPRLVPVGRSVVVTDPQRERVLAQQRLAQPTAAWGHHHHHHHHRSGSGGGVGAADEGRGAATGEAAAAAREGEGEGGHQGGSSTAAGTNSCTADGGAGPEREEGCDVGGPPRLPPQQQHGRCSLVERLHQTSIRHVRHHHLDALAERERAECTFAPNTARRRCGERGGAAAAARCVPAPSQRYAAATASSAARQPKRAARDVHVESGGDAEAAAAVNGCPADNDADGHPRSPLTAAHTFRPVLRSATPPPLPSAYVPVGYVETVAKLRERAHVTRMRQCSFESGLLRTSPAALESLRAASMRLAEKPILQLSPARSRSDVREVVLVRGPSSVSSPAAADGAVLVRARTRSRSGDEGARCRRASTASPLLTGDASLPNVSVERDTLRTTSRTWQSSSERRREGPRGVPLAAAGDKEGGRLWEVLQKKATLGLDCSWRSTVSLGSTSDGSGDGGGRHHHAALRASPSPAGVAAVRRVVRVASHPQRSYAAKLALSPATLRGAKFHQ